MCRLAFLYSLTEDNFSTLTGDFNADLSDSDSIFAKHLLHFCNDSNLIISSKMLLLNNC